MQIAIGIMSSQYANNIFLTIKFRRVHNDRRNKSFLKGRYAVTIPRTRLTILTVIFVVFSHGCYFGVYYDRIFSLGTFRL
jgi:hypothetical protein